MHTNEKQADTRLQVGVGKVCRRALVKASVIILYVYIQAETCRAHVHQHWPVISSAFAQHIMQGLLECSPEGTRLSESNLQAACLAVTVWYAATRQEPSYGKPDTPSLSLSSACFTPGSGLWSSALEHPCYPAYTLPAANGQWHTTAPPTSRTPLALTSMHAVCYQSKAPKIELWRLCKVCCSCASRSRCFFSAIWRIISSLRCTSSIVLRFSCALQCSPKT